MFIGGVLSLISTIWLTTLSFAALTNLANSWVDPPGRFITTLIENGTILPVITFSALLILGLAILGFEYFKKENTEG